MNSAAEESLKR